MKLYVFNPEADMALSNNTENYMPPAVIQQMAADLALLPIWYAEPQSKVLASSAYNLDYLKLRQSQFKLDVDLITPPELENETGVWIEPWGWNLSLKKRLIKLGVSEKELPTLQSLYDYRMLSSRMVGVKLLETFKGVAQCGGENIIVNDVSECRDFAQRNSRCVFKKPWSGSGKGLCWCYDGFDEIADKWCSRALKEQGALIVSSIYDKYCDFAMEFYISNVGQVSFVGYSWFDTNVKGAYQGNNFISDMEFEKLMSEKYLISSDSLHRIQIHLKQQLSTIYSAFYKGYVGVDMLIYADRSNCEYRIFPCVEVNLRMNMGVLSCLFRTRHLSTHAKAVFQLKYYATTEALQEEASRLSLLHPLCVVDNKLRSGFLPLVPITPRSRYLAFVLAD